MASREEAIQAVQTRFGQFQAIRPTRVAILGDGRGNAASNLIVRDDLVYARHKKEDADFFTVINEGAVTPAHNLAVRLGYKDDDPAHEKVLGVHTGTYIGDAASTVAGPGRHGGSHEFGGGDEVFIDSRLFKPGLVMPQNPTDMTVRILSFVHFYESWKLFNQVDSLNMSEWKPETGVSRYVTIAVDPRSNSLVTRPGFTFTGESLIGILTGTGGAGASFDNIPAPSGDEIPLAAILLTGSTTRIDWGTEVSNIFDLRIFPSVAQLEVLTRIKRLEENTSVGDLPSTGAQEDDDNEETIDGGIF